MNTPERICAFYSRGPHFVRLLKFLRAQYPAARLTAVVPEAFPAEAALAVADEVIKTPVDPRRRLAALWASAGLLRAGRYDLLVIMFDSPRLRVVSALSGAKARYCYTIDGRYFPVRLALVRQFAGSIARQVKGRLLYAYLHYVVYFRPVQKS